MMAKVDMNAWKKQNYNRNVRVSNKTIDQLRAGKTFSGNVAAFKKTGMTGEQREAMNRFYGKARTSAAFGNSVLKNPNTGVTTAVPKSGHTTTTARRVAGARVADWASTTYKPATPKPPTASTVYKPTTGTQKNATSKKASKSWWSKAGGFVANEVLGIDDIRRSINYASKGQFRKAGKSLGTAAFELGTSAAAVAAAIPTGGASLAGKGALIAARQGAKVGAKAAAKAATKKTARAGAGKAIVSDLKAAGKAVVSKSILTGSVKTGVKGAARTAWYAAGTGMHAATQTARRGAAAAGKVSARVESKLAGKATVPTLAEVKVAGIAAKRATKGMSGAAKAASAEYAKVRAKRAAYEAAKKAAQSRRRAAGKLAATGVGGKLAYKNSRSGKK